MNRFVALHNASKNIWRRAIMPASVAGLAAAMVAAPAAAAVAPSGGGWPVCVRVAGAATASEVKASNPDALKVLAGERMTPPAKNAQADPKKAASVLRAGSC